MGIDGTFLHWRGIMGPGGLTPSRWRLGTRSSDRWSVLGMEDRDGETRWTGAYLASKPFTDFLTQDRDTFEKILREVGFIKP
jgi:tripartite-type tricarboxylate transporter receptor subunit TctC